MARENLYNLRSLEIDRKLLKPRAFYIIIKLNRFLQTIAHIRIT